MQKVPNKCGSLKLQLLNRPQLGRIKNNDFARNLNCSMKLTLENMLKLQSHLQRSIAKLKSVHIPIYENISGGRVICAPDATLIGWAKALNEIGGRKRDAAWRDACKNALYVLPYLMTCAIQTLTIWPMPLTAFWTCQPYFLYHGGGARMSSGGMANGMTTSTMTTTVNIHLSLLSSTLPFCFLGT